MSSHRLFSSWHPGKRQISAEMNVETKTHLANERRVSLCFMDVVLCTHRFSLNWYLILWWYHGNSAVCHLDILWELLQSSRMISISLRTQLGEKSSLFSQKLLSPQQYTNFCLKKCFNTSQVYGSTYTSSFSPWNSQREGLI